MFECIKNAAKGTLDNTNYLAESLIVADRDRKCGTQRHSYRTKAYCLLRSFVGIDDTVPLSAAGPQACLEARL